MKRKRADIKDMIFTERFAKATLKMKEENKRLYDLFVIDEYIEKRTNGFVVVKIKNATERGTVVLSKLCLTRKEYRAYCSKINWLVRQYNKTYGTFYLTEKDLIRGEAKELLNLELK